VRPEGNIIAPKLYIIKSIFLVFLPPVAARTEIDE
jgi:hypothetical protein